MTLQEAVTNQEFKNVRVPKDCASWRKLTANIPTLAEQRWYLKRALGYTWIFYIPRNHWRQWTLLAVFKVHRDAQAYANTL